MLKIFSLFCQENPSKTMAILKYKSIFARRKVSVFIKKKAE
jgi:hypothetical protein